MNYKETILNEIIKSDNKKDAVTSVMKTLNKSQTTLRVGAAILAGVGYYVYDSYRSKKEDAAMLEKLCDDINKVEKDF